MPSGYVSTVILLDVVISPILSLPQKNVPDCKVYGANMGPTWGRHDRGSPHVGPINFAIWGCRVLYSLLNTAPVNGTMVQW